MQNPKTIGECRECRWIVTKEDTGSCECVCETARCEMGFGYDEYFCPCGTFGCRFWEAKDKGAGVEVTE